ncbi:MAG: heat-inducible transcription repressor HrcA [Clostridia bacterium]|nr:heat-inducible transcription repressor HrcA [Clostridia bacterium]
MELDNRKRHVVSAMVDEYIRTGEPVGSKAIAALLEYAVSSATIRNDMAELSAAGYLTQPHTSAGRIPTPKAFRLYVDQLMPRRPLAEDVCIRIDEYLENAAGDPERLMERASDLLAKTTGYAVLSAAPDTRGARVSRVEVLPTGLRLAAVLLMTDDGRLHTRVCRLDGGVDVQALSQVARHLTRAFGGKPLADISPALVQGSLLKLLGGHGLCYAPLLTAFADLVQESAESDIRLSGQFNLLQHPDYPPENARSLLGFLSHREQLATMLTDYRGGLCVLIGNESPRPELCGSSIIVTRYAVGPDHGGTLGLVGPIRMDYARTIARLEHVANTVGRLLTTFNEK